MAVAAIPTSFWDKRSRVLIASADSSFRKRLLSTSGNQIGFSEEAGGGAQALAKLAQFSCDSVILDRNLPDLDSEEVASLIRQRYPQTEVEFVDSRDTAQNSASPGSEGNAVSADLQDSCSGNPPELKPASLALPLLNAQVLPGMIGKSRAMQSLYRMARMVAPRDTTVLVTGETGTGKEMVAQAIHKLSSRASQPFVVVNCAAIPETLFESELFGYTRGAFTGAVQSRLGRVHVAQGGTLFLDEIGELPLSMQAKLLRFLQNGEVQRLGSSEIFKVDVRVICATNMLLPDLVQKKQFRQDLFYRLAVFPLEVPPLRDRPEDIDAIAQHFLEQFSAEHQLPCKFLTPAGLAHLQRGHWAGNVRELLHALERAFILAGTENELTAEYFRLPQPFAG